MTRTLLVCLTAFLAAPAVAVDRKELKPGLVATFTDAAGSAVTRLEPTVGLTLAADESPHPKLAGVARIGWAGYIQIVTPGKYVFTGPGLTVTLNGTAVPLGQAVELTPGVQAFEAVFVGTAPTRIELRWKGPGFRDEPLPYFFLGHRPQDRPAAYAADLHREHGRLLFEELACQKCHTPETPEFADRTGPGLSEIGSRVYPGWLDAWLADPAKLRPHTAMPKLFTDDPKGRAERYAVVKYLTSLGGPLTESKNPSFSNEIVKQIASGERLFTAVGCANCHGKNPPATNKLTEDDDDKPAPPPPPGDRFHAVGTAGPQAQYAIGALGSKTTPVRLAEYLQDPLKTNPHGRMPRMGLSADEARDLARFMCRTTDDAIDRMNPKGTTLLPADLLPADLVPADEKAAFEKRKPDDQWKALGRRLVVSKGCVNCHTVEKLAPAKAPALADVRRKAGGCVAEQPAPAKVPVYTLTADQRSALTAFLADAPGAGKKSPIHAARVAPRRFQCLNCHLRDGEGGIGTELAEKMKALERGENADNDPLPPRLTGVGHKARPDWLREVILAGGRARPWMSLRMPQYGDANVGGLPAALTACDGAAPEADAKSKVTATQIEAGRKLAGKEGLGCIGCHDISGFQGGGTRGPDLALTAKRVRPEWNARWMHNPQRLAPGTRMPSNFVNGQSAFAGVLNGDADAQIEALWAYFALGPGLPLPVGLEPPKGLILVVRDRPEVLRTFLPDGAGAKAIAVGYPGGGGLAFDAHAARLAYAWEGNFVDASPVWNNRGGAPAKLLGPKYLTPPPGHPWAVGGDAPPDFASRADDFAWGKAVPNDQIFQGRMHVAFLGYTLDAAGFPTFRYTVSEPGRPLLGVADTPLPVRGAVAVGLKRTFGLMVEPADPTAVVWLRLGQSSKEPRLTGNRAVLSDGTRAQVIDAAGGALHAVKAGDIWQVLLKRPATAGTVAVTTWAVPKDDEELIQGVPVGK